MRIAIAAENNNGLDSAVSHHFGRCPYFILVDVEVQEVKEVTGVKNPYHSKHNPGQVPAFINSHKVEVMLSGGMGRRAVEFFQQYDIQPVTGASGSVRQSLQRYLDGELHEAQSCAEHGHHHHSHHS